MRVPDASMARKIAIPPLDQCFHFVNLTNGAALVCAAIACAISSFPSRELALLHPRRQASFSSCDLTNGMVQSLDGCCCDVDACVIAVVCAQGWKRSRI